MDRHQGNVLPNTDEQVLIEQKIAEEKFNINQYTRSNPGVANKVAGIHSQTL
jgi:hypothetical protein